MLQVFQLFRAGKCLSTYKQYFIANFTRLFLTYLHTEFHTLGPSIPVVITVEMSFKRTWNCLHVVALRS
jgi:hypothetical protein